MPSLNIEWKSDYEFYDHHSCYIDGIIIFRLYASDTRQPAERWSVSYFGHKETFVFVKKMFKEVYYNLDEAKNDITNFIIKSEKLKAFQ